MPGSRIKTEKFGDRKIVKLEAGYPAPQRPPFCACKFFSLERCESRAVQEVHAVAGRLKPREAFECGGPPPLSHTRCIQPATNFRAYSKSARGLAHSKTLTRISVSPVCAKRLGVRRVHRRFWAGGVSRIQLTSPACQSGAEATAPSADATTQRLQLREAS